MENLDKLTIEELEVLASESALLLEQKKREDKIKTIKDLVQNIDFLYTLFSEDTSLQFIREFTGKDISKDDIKRALFIDPNIADKVQAKRDEQVKQEKLSKFTLSMLDRVPSAYQRRLMKVVFDIEGTSYVLDTQVVADLGITRPTPRKDYYLSYRSIIVFLIITLLKEGYSLKDIISLNYSAVKSDNFTSYPVSSYSSVKVADDIYYTINNIGSSQILPIIRKAVSSFNISNVEFWYKI